MTFALLRSVMTPEVLLLVVHDRDVHGNLKSMRSVWLARDNQPHGGCHTRRRVVHY